MTSVDVEDLSPELELKSAQQVAAILEDFIDNGVGPDEITLGFMNDGDIHVAFSGVVMGTIKRTIIGDVVDAAYTPRSLN